MVSRFRMKKRVEFADTDMAGIVHFANYVRYMEETEHAFFRSLGCSVYEEIDNRSVITWPRLHVQCDYAKPLRFEDEVEIELIVSKRTNKTLNYHFYFFARDEQGELQRVATGSMIAVCVKFDTITRAMQSIEIPERFSQIVADPNFHESNITI